MDSSESTGGLFLPFGNFHNHIFKFWVIQVLKLILHRFLTESYSETVINMVKMGFMICILIGI